MYEYGCMQHSAHSTHSTHTSAHHVRDKRQHVGADHRCGERPPERFLDIFRVHAGGHNDRVPQLALVLVAPRLFLLERHEPRHHLRERAPGGEPVGGRTVRAAPAEHLWRHVPKGPAAAVVLPLAVHLLRNPKVCQLHIPALADDDILRFDVAVENALAVKITEGLAHLAATRQGRVRRECGEM